MRLERGGNRFIIFIKALPPNPTATLSSDFHLNICRFNCSFKPKLIAVNGAIQATRATEPTKNTYHTRHHYIHELVSDI